LPGVRGTNTDERPTLKSPTSQPASRSTTAARTVWTVALLASAALGCKTGGDIAPTSYTCGNVDPPATAMAGEASDCQAYDQMYLPPEPTLPVDPTDTTCILQATHHTTDTDNGWLPDETTLDTANINGALGHCAVVKLVTNGDNNAFVSGPISMTSSVLWVDAGVTLYASRNPTNYSNQPSGVPTDCGETGVNDSSACKNFIEVHGTSPGIVGDGIIDGQGGEPLIGKDYSWWQLSSALAMIDGSIGNPTLINLNSGTTGFLMYRITLHNSPKFHVKITSTPPGGATAACTPGAGFIVWGVTVLTPSRWLNTQGLLMSPHLSRNTDGIDPGETSFATCGVLAHNTISTGDDHIAIKGGHGISNIYVAHNHFGTGHGMSIGSETYGGVSGLTVCDLTIDADSRPVGQGASPGDFNGIRVKSDSSRGGTVDNIVFKNVCMRDVTNAILIDTAYNPLFSGTLIPNFKSLTFQNIHDTTCMATTQPVVTLNGFSVLYPAGPITLDNAIVDNIGPEAVEAEFANIITGPGPVNFAQYISGQDVNVTAMPVDDSVAPIHCTFPTLPTPTLPAGWLR
jgi:polygalacturonase